jgi:hypothetical protein
MARRLGVTESVRQRKGLTAHAFVKLIVIKHRNDLLGKRLSVSERSQQAGFAVHN